MVPSLNWAFSDAQESHDVSIESPSPFCMAAISKCHLFSKMHDPHFILSFPMTLPPTEKQKTRAKIPSTSCRKTYTFASSLTTSLLPSWWPGRNILCSTENWIPSITAVSGMLLHPSLPPYWLHPMNMWARHCLQSPGPPPDSTFSLFSVTEKFP